MIRPNFSLLIAVGVLFVGGPLLAAPIQMLPPTDFGGTTPCRPAGESDPPTFGVLQWDGETSIKCVPNFFGTSAGLVGIGTTNPQNLLHLYSAQTDNTSMYITNASTGGNTYGLFSTGSSSAIGPGKFSISYGSTNTPRLIIDSVGNVGLSTNSGSNAGTMWRLNVGNDPNPTGRPAFGVADSGDLVVTGGSDSLWAIFDKDIHTVLFWDANLDHMGLAGNSDPAFTVRVHGSFYADAGGIGTSSDVRLKTDLTPIKKALDKVDALRGVTYNWRVKEFPDRKFSSDRQAGLIAQDVEKVLPEAVMTDGDGFKVLDYGKVDALFVEAIKDLKKQNEGLMEKVSKLEEDRDALSDRIEALEAKMK